MLLFSHTEIGEKKIGIRKNISHYQIKKVKCSEGLVQSFMSSEESGKDGKGGAARLVLYVDFALAFLTCHKNVSTTGLYDVKV